MKVTLTHDGKSVELDLTAEQMSALGLKEEKKRTGYERVSRYKHYWFVNDEDCILEGTESITNTPIANEKYSIGNYYSDWKLAGDNARADRLMRQLRMFAAENGGIPSVEDWRNMDDDHLMYLIQYCYSYHAKTRLTVDVASPIYRKTGVVYFNSRDAAENALEKFHDELIWYFTEYEAMLR